MKGKAEIRVSLTVEFDSIGEWETVRGDLAEVSPGNRSNSLTQLAMAMDEAREDADRLQHPQEHGHAI